VEQACVVLKCPEDSTCWLGNSCHQIENTSHLRENSCCRFDNTGHLRDNRTRREVYKIQTHLGNCRQSAPRQQPLEGPTPSGPKYPHRGRRITFKQHSSATINPTWHPLTNDFAVHHHPYSPTPLKDRSCETMPKRKSGQSPFCQFQKSYSSMNYIYYRHNSQKQKARVIFPDFLLKIHRKHSTTGGTPTVSAQASDAAPAVKDNRLATSSMINHAMRRRVGLRAGSGRGRSRRPCLSLLRWAK
jgi:hypothetical protein